MAEPTAPTLREAAEYRRQRSVRLACTQLGTAYTATRARRIVEEWIELFAAGQDQLAELDLVTRTSKRLFASLAGLTELERLSVKWGDYCDLTVLSELLALRSLSLRGASAVTQVEGITRLPVLERLALEGFRGIADASGLGNLVTLKDLEVGGNWIAPRVASIGSIGFVRRLQNLESVLLHTIVVEDLDYTPLLDLPHLRSVRVMKARGMSPSHEELKSRLPWSG